MLCSTTCHKPRLRSCPDDPLACTRNCGPGHSPVGCSTVYSTQSLLHLPIFYRISRRNYSYSCSVRRTSMNVSSPRPGTKYKHVCRHALQCHYHRPLHATSTASPVALPTCNCDVPSTRTVAVLHSWGVNRQAGDGGEEWHSLPTYCRYSLSVGSEFASGRPPSA